MRLSQAIYGAILACSFSMLAHTAAADQSSRFTNESDTELSKKRAASSCSFGRGNLPSETLGVDVTGVCKVRGSDGRCQSWLRPHEMPIKKIVVVMQENRSFDHYYGRLKDYLRRNFPNHPVSKGQNSLDVPRLGEAFNPVDMADPNPTNPSKKVLWRHANMLCHSDTNHEWWGVHMQHNGGLMNGFVQTNHGYFESTEPKVTEEYLNGARAMDYYDERDIPFYYKLAATFGIGDKHYSSVLGPTWPNRDFLYGGTSRGLTYNVSVEPGGNIPLPGNIASYMRQKLMKDPAIIFDQLNAANIDWRIYIDGDDALTASIPRVGAWTSGANLGARGINMTVGGNTSYFTSRWTRSFLDDAKNGKLPPVSFIDPNIREDVKTTDEHPPGDIQVGQNFVHKIVKALMDGPDWKHTALFITYDEHGGFYDHAPPPRACAPDGYAPKTGGDWVEYDKRTLGEKFKRYGVRVPLIVVSPWAKKNHVSHVVHDHTSILRFIQAKFNLPALTKRDANANALFDYFDFRNFNDPSKAPSADVKSSEFPDSLARIDSDKFLQCTRVFLPAVGPISPTAIATNPYKRNSVCELSSMFARIAPTLKTGVYDGTQPFTSLNMNCNIYPK